MTSTATFFSQWQSGPLTLRPPPHCGVCGGDSYATDVCSGGLVVNIGSLPFENEVIEKLTVPHRLGDR